MTATRTATASVLCFAALSACDDPQIVPQNIVDNRVLAARLAVTGDLARAWPLPGETASIAWLVVDPAEPRPLGWHFDVCVAQQTIRDVPRCAAPVFAAVTQGMPALGTPAFSFEVPDEASLGAVARLAVLGVVCADGTPATVQPWPAWGCEGEGAQATLVSFDVTVQRGSETNHNPSLADDVVVLDGVEWPAPAQPDSPVWGCASEPPASALPHVPADGVDHRVSVIFGGDDREPVAAAGSLSPEREALYVAHLSTVGEFERQFSVVEASDARPVPDVQVTWTAPEQVDPAGFRARFYVVVRDLRGGADWTVREVCMVP